MDDKKIMELLEELDEIARDHSPNFDYGLPLFGRALSKMKKVIKDKTNG